MPGWESECQIERSKTVARWFAIAILAGFLYWQRTNYQDLSLGRMGALVGSAAAINLIHSVLLFARQHCPEWYKYLSVGLDLAVLSVAIRYTGFNQSPFFYFYFLVLVSNCIRYGLLMSLYIAALVNVFYAVTLAVGPNLKPTVLGGEGLKILAFWGVALYGGGVAARIRRQSHVIDAYEQTIAELRRQIDSENRTNESTDRTE